MLVILKRDEPRLGLTAGAQIAEISLAPEVSLNYVLDALRHGVARDVVEPEPEPAPPPKKKVKKKSTWGGST